jgi:hypothetical protein
MPGVKESRGHERGHNGTLNVCFPARFRATHLADVPLVLRMKLPVGDEIFPLLVKGADHLQQLKEK